MNKIERKNLIVTCAKKLFVEKGFHDTSVSDIITHSRIVRSTFYAHFKNKMEIFSILVDQFSDILRKAILGINISKASADLSITEQIKEMARTLISAFDENRDLTTLLITAPMGHDNLFDNKVEELYAGLLSAIKQLLIEGMEGNTIVRMNPDIISYAILGNIKQLLIQWIIFNEIEDIDIALDDIIRFNLYGIAKKEE